jgi:TRAP-type C4-dicarboxylate transport system permease small subunit
MFVKLLKLVDKYLEETVCATLLFSLVVVLGVQVFMRFILHSSISWQEEICRFLFIWTVYFGISLGVKRREHIRITLLFRFLPDSVSKMVYYLSEILWLFFSVFILVISIPMLKTMFEYKHASAALQWNMAYIYLIIPISFLLTSYRIVQLHYLDYKNKKSFLPGKGD